MNSVGSPTTIRTDTNWFGYRRNNPSFFILEGDALNLNPGAGGPFRFRSHAATNNRRTSAMRTAHFEEEPSNLIALSNQKQTSSSITAYSLRHTYICLRLLEGADIYQIAKNCRTSVEMIEKYYAAHISTTLDAAAINVRRTKKPTNQAQGDEQPLA